MSREIKFRAWITNLSIPFMAVQGEPDIETLGSFFHHYCGSEQEKLMQFTGLKDQKGNDIYEGDILKNPSGKKDIVIWFGNGFYGKSKHSHDKNRIISNPLCFDYLENKEIIGNIYENPDLLTN